MDDQELLVKYAKKQAGFARVTMILTILITVIIAAAGTLLFFKAKEIKVLTEKANAVLDDLNTKEFNSAVTGIKKSAEVISGLDVDAFNDGVDALTAAANELSEVDTGELNQMVGSIGKLAEDLNGVTGTLKDLIYALTHIFG